MCARASDIDNSSRVTCGLNLLNDKCQSLICWPMTAGRTMLSALHIRPTGFAVANVSVWNTLPDNLRHTAVGRDSFRQYLKTFCLQRTNACSTLEVL